MRLLRPLAMPRAAAALVAAALVAGCAAPGGGAPSLPQQTLAQTQSASSGPARTPFRTITGFSSALRCMDNLMIDYGVRDVSMLVEEIVDSTKKVNAGTRDMFITAVSDMTRRSRAIRLVAFGKDTSHAISFQSSAQRQSPYEVTPAYDIKGSVTQFDENVIRNQRDAGIGLAPFLHLGVSRDAATSILGLDLSVLLTEDLSVLPGVTSRNSVVILKSGSGRDGDAAFHKFGISYTMSLSQSEGQAQALRGLVELAVIELMGKLTKTPYWKCLGAERGTNEEVRLELSDWYYAMASGRGEIVAYFQNQLRRRGFYVGPVDGDFNPAIDEAIGRYRAALGLSAEAVIDEAFFDAFLGADHGRIRPPAQPSMHRAGAAPAPPPAPQAAAAPPLQLTLATSGGKSAFARGEPIGLVVTPSQDAYVYCYLRDERARITRFFPNRFAPDARVGAGRPLSLPGTMRFALTMNAMGVIETIACLASPVDPAPRLSVEVMGTDFEPLALAGLQQIRTAFDRGATAPVVMETFDVQPK